MRSQQKVHETRVSSKLETVSKRVGRGPVKPSNGPMYPQGMCCACLISVMGALCVPLPTWSIPGSITSGPARPSDPWWVSASGIIPGDREKQEMRLWGQSCPLRTPSSWCPQEPSVPWDNHHGAGTSHAMGTRSPEPLLPLATAFEFISSSLSCKCSLK